MKTNYTILSTIQCQCRFCMRNLSCVLKSAEVHSVHYDDTLYRIVDDFPTSTASTPSDHHPGYEVPSLVSSTNSFDTIDSNQVLLYPLQDYSSSNPVLPYPVPDYYNPQFTSSVTTLTI